MADYKAPASPPTSGNDEKKGHVDLPPDHLAAGSGDDLHRRLDNRQIQLVAIGGSIGTALFVSIGNGLTGGGPASLFIAYALYSCVLGLVNNSCAEMTVYMPITGGFIRLAGHWVDDALGFMVGWNFFLYESLLIPFEISALTLVMSFWSDKIAEPGPTAAICIGCIICYALLNMIAVRAYGEAEFWLSGGKVILLFILFAFTFITMVGGNPKGDAYGFRSWNTPGAFVGATPKAKFEGFLASLWNASFAVVGPEYISMVAAEAKRPRQYIKLAFKTVYYRFALFFVGSALAVGIVVASNDPKLLDRAGNSSAEGSPYVVAMENLGIKVLPDIVNALMLTSIFSAGNTYTYCATRSLYGLALEGRAPRFLRKCTANGVPIYCFAVVMCFPFLSLLQVGGSSAEVIVWLVELITAGALIDFMVMNITFIFYYRACKAQGVDRKKMPYYGRFQPYGAIIALVIQFIITIFYGYKSFAPWGVDKFFRNYTMQILAPILFFGWKLLKKTRFVKPHECDLVWEAPIVDRYEASCIDPPTGFWQEILMLVGIGRNKKRSADLE